MSFSDKPYTGRYLLKRLIYEYVHPHLYSLLWAILCMFIAASCNAIIVRLIEPTINQIIIVQNKTMIFTLPACIILISGVKGGAEYYETYLVKYVGQKVLTDIQMLLYKRLLYADIDFIQSQASGLLISRFTNDLGLLRGAVSTLLVGCAKHFMSVILLVLVMLNMEPTLTIIIFIVCSFAIYFIQRVGKNIRKIVRGTQEQVASYTARLDETFHSISIIKSFSAEETEINLAQNKVNNILDSYKKATRLEAASSPITEILGGIAVAIVLWYSGMLMLGNKTTPGSLMAFIAAFVAAYRPFKSLLSLNVNLQEGLAATERIFKLFDIEPKIVDAVGAESYKLIAPSIKFSAVELSFGEKKILKNINIDIEGGQTVAIVGKSGSGKTSIANLLLRFYDPCTGHILVGEIELRKFKISNLRQQIALVTQETILFDASVASNIAYGGKYDMEEVIDAAIKAEAHEFIMRLPEKYESVIGNRGFKLSGGQRQRLAIARAIFKKAEIMILDEATSSLDYQTELEIQKSLLEICKNKTSIIITHRLNNITDFNKIIVMKDGSVAEVGTHNELMSKKGEYYRLRIGFNKKNINEDI